MILVTHSGGTTEEKFSEHYHLLIIKASDNQPYAPNTMHNNNLSDK